MLTENRLRLTFANIDIIPHLKSDIKSPGTIVRTLFLNNKKMVVAYYSIIII